MAALACAATWRAVGAGLVAERIGPPARRAVLAGKANRLYGTTAAGREAPASPDPALLFGRPTTAAQPSSSALVQQANAVFSRVRGGHASAAQLVEALQQLAAIGRDAGDRVDDIEALASRPLSRQLLRELTAKLPRDAAEQVEWEASWTPQVISGLRQLRFREVDPQLGIRLGHTLVQTSPSVALETLLHSTIDLCSAFVGSTGCIPDDYAVWVLGDRLESLCEGKPLGELPMQRLVPLLHLFAHPALRGRIPARVSPAVLKHVRRGLVECTPGDVAKLVEAYADELSAADIVSEAIRTLVAPGRLGTSSLPELTVIADSLPACLQRGDFEDRTSMGTIANAVLERLLVLVGQEEPAADLELVVACAAEAVRALEIVGFPPSDLVVSVTNAAGQRAATSPAALSADALSRLLCLGLARHASASEPSVAAWQAKVASVLQERLGELPGSSRLAELASHLTFASAISAGAPVGAEVYEALQAVIMARASSGAVEHGDLAMVAWACASAGVLESGFLQTFDAEATLAKGLRPTSVARIAWAASYLAAVDGASSGVLWPLVATQLTNSRVEWSVATAEDKALLYEALAASSQLLEAPWVSDSVVGDILTETETDSNVAAWGCRAAWLERRRLVAQPASSHADDVAALLGEMGLEFSRDLEGEDGLYVMPFFLPKEKVIIDLMTVAARHPISRELRGEVALRQQIWTEQGRSILAIPETSWAQLSAGIGSDATAAAVDVATKRRQWMEEKLNHLRRMSLAKEANLSPEAVARLQDVPFHPDAEGDETGINLDGLTALAQRSPDIQDRAITQFLSTWQQTNVKNPTGWLIGILKREEKNAADRRNRQADEAKIISSPKKDAAPKAADVATKQDWSHPDGRTLGTVQVGQIVKGTVTNILYGRVWVDAGFVQDATFLAGTSRYTKGMTLEGLKVVSVNQERSRIEVKPTAATRAARRTAGQAARKAATARKAASETALASDEGGKRAAATEGSASMKDSQQRKELQQAAARQPAGGWGRGDSGRQLAELRVGEEVAGRVTNVLHQRVWVDIGAASDASFSVRGGQFKVGDELKGLVISGIDLTKNQIQVQLAKNSA